MLTLVVEGRRPLLGTLTGDAEAGPGTHEAPRVELSALGRCIAQEEVEKISEYYPQVEVWKVCMMPDHIHLIVSVREDMPIGKHLGKVVRGFKTGCSRAWWKLAGMAEATGTTGPSGKAEGTQPQPPGQACTPSCQGGALAGEAAVQRGTPSDQGRALAGEAAVQRDTQSDQGSEEVGGASRGTLACIREQGELTGRGWVPSAFPEGRLPVLFEPGYNDKLLRREGQLDRWKAYLDDNPRRLLLKRLHPELFTVLSGMEVAGRPCEVVGNRFLLDIPDKMAVIVHRRYTEEECARLREEWLDCGERGGVLVSAAIAPREKEVLREAMDRGYSIILLRENGFPQLYKPSGEAFDACSDGRLLQISPWEYHMERKTISRAQCLELNELAESIAGSTR